MHALRVCERASAIPLEPAGGSERCPSKRCHQSAPCCPHSSPGDPAARLITLPLSPSLPACLRKPFLPQGKGGLLGYGPGDLLFSFLGVIIISFAFKIVEQVGGRRAGTGGLGALPPLAPSLCHVSPHGYTDCEQLGGGRAGTAGVKPSALQPPYCIMCFCTIIWTVKAKGKRWVGGRACGEHPCCLF